MLEARLLSGSNTGWLTLLGTVLSLYIPYTSVFSVVFHTGRDKASDLKSISGSWPTSQHCADPQGG